MKLTDGQRLDPFGRAQRFDLEPQLPADFFLGRALALQLFDLIAVAQ